MRRAAAAAALAVAAAGCEPEIGTGVYYCGPERACPPELACDGVTATCVFPFAAQPFACEPGSEAREPDDDLGAAPLLGVIGCGAATAEAIGCVSAAGDVDHLAVVTPASCPSRLSVRLMFPVSFAPVEVDLLDADGAVVATGVVCQELDEVGQTRVCIDHATTPDTRHVIRVRLAAGGPDCDGACAFNRYRLSIL